MKAMMFLGLAAGMVAGVAWGNGGGYHYGVRFTGTVKPFEPSGVEKVAILSEKLDIELKRTGAAVRVRYLMQNMSKRKVKVRFGFPVEVADWNSYMYLAEGEERPSPAELVAGNCADYRVVAGGKELAAKFQEEKLAKPDATAIPVPDRLAGIGGWLVSEMTFKGGQEQVVEISYRSRYEEAGGSVSEDWFQGPTNFKYRLSTGAVWHGPIREGVVTVTATGVPAEEVEMFKPPGRFRRDGAQWIWKFKDLEPTLAEDIEIHTTPAQSFHADYSDDGWGDRGYFEQGGVWSKVHRDYAATASSSLPADGKLNYGAGNVRGLTREDEFRAWSEGEKGDGIGAWLELKPKQARPLFGLKLWPGYGKSAALFGANNRPKTIEVELNGSHRFEAVLDDRNEPQMVRVKGYTKPVERVRVTIKDVYRGTKFRDTCVSDLVLYSRLKKKPEIQGAR